MRVFLVPPPALLVAPMIRALAASGHEVRNDPAAVVPVGGFSKAERDGFLLAVDRMLESECVVADVSEASPGAAWCVAWFLAKGRLVVLTCRKDRREKLDFMLAGNPSPWQRLVLYEGPDDIETALAAAVRF